MCVSSVAWYSAPPAGLLTTSYCIPKLKNRTKFNVNIGITFMKVKSTVNLFNSTINHYGQSLTTLSSTTARTSTRTHLSSRERFIHGGKSLENRDGCLSELDASRARGAKSCSVSLRFDTRPPALSGAIGVVGPDTFESTVT